MSMMLMLLGASGAGGYLVEKSLRFVGADSASLRRTFATGNRKKWTYSYWIKRCGDTVANHWYNSFLWCAPGLSGNLRFDDATTSKMYGILASGITFTSDTVFRDYGAWMHIVVVYDSENTTAGDRIQLYVNGVRDTTVAVTGTLDGNDSYFNVNDTHAIGQFNTNTGLNCYLADVYFIDGYAKVPGDFAETDGTTGQWVPIEYAGTYAAAAVGPGGDAAGSTTLTWGSGTQDSGWALSSSDAVATYTGSGYSHVYTAALGSTTTYTFKMTTARNSTNGGWFFSAANSGHSDTHPNELGSNTLGHRAGNANIGAWGTFATANSVTEAQGALTGFDDVDPANGTSMDMVINMSERKVWCRATGASGWIGGGDPEDDSTTASFLLPSGTIYFAHVSYSATTTLTLSDLIITEATGVNSCHLKFDGSDPGEDSSGEGNDWTANNLTVTDGSNPVNIDVLNDTPTTDETSGTGNYCTFNPSSSVGQLVQGNLQVHNGAGNYTGVSLFGFDSGKWYGEFTLGSSHSYPGIGFTYEGQIPSVGWMATQAPYFFVNEAAGSLSSYPGGAMTWNSGSPISAALSPGVFQLALDCDNGKGWIGFEDTWYNDEWNTSGSAANPATGANPTFTLATDKTWYFFVHANDTLWTANFGQRAFEETKPSGFLAPNSYNIGETAITSGSYTGNGSADGPVIFTNCTPATLKIDTSAPASTSVTFSPTTVDRLSSGFKIRHASTNNGSGTTYHWLVTSARAFKYANAQTNS